VPRAKPKDSPPIATETVAQRYARLRRDAVFGDAGTDTAFLTEITVDLGTIVSRAVGYFDEIARRADTLADPAGADLANLARDAARWTNLQSGRIGQWFKTAQCRPTDQPNAEIEVLFCVPRGRMPKQGLYVTNEAGAGTWQIYSALQDHILDYAGPTPDLWMFAPMKPPQEYWDDFGAVEDAPLAHGRDRFRAALEPDLAAAGIGLDPEALIAWPSIARLIRENDQLRNAHMRTAEALGVAANAHDPARRAREIIQNLETKAKP
jgi:hypothetical protein